MNGKSGKPVVQEKAGEASGDMLEKSRLD